MKKRQVTERIFQCPICKYKAVAFKRSNRKTSVGHCKNMWCPFCREEHNFIQIPSWQEDEESLY